MSKSTKETQTHDKKMNYIITAVTLYFEMSTNGEKELNITLIPI